jgi:hypothetical protein
MGHFIQAKLKISQPGDMYEQEADRVAEEVMRMPDPEPIRGETSVSGQTLIPQIHRVCAECEEELHRQAAEEEEELGEPVDMNMPTPDELLEPEEEIPLSPTPGDELETPLQRACTECEEEERMQAREVPGQGTVVNANLGDFHGGGQPLDTALRAFFEPRFGYAFDQVRVHTDSQAAESAKAVNALAFTVGRDVVFGAGQYAPDTTVGRRLLAHELAHVIQQNPSPTLARYPGTLKGPVQIQTMPVGNPILQRWSIGDPVPGINTIVCDGSGGITTQLGATGNADQTRCLRDCIEEHEQSHRTDALAENANICSGVTAGRTVRPNAGTQRNQTEIRASNVEIACLRGKLPTADATCRPIINSRITQMEAYRDSFGSP